MIKQVFGVGFIRGHIVSMMMLKIIAADGFVNILVTYCILILKDHRVGSGVGNEFVVGRLAPVRREQVAFDPGLFFILSVGFLRLIGLGLDYDDDDEHSDDDGVRDHSGFKECFHFPNPPLLRSFQDVVPQRVGVGLVPARDGERIQVVQILRLLDEKCFRQVRALGRGEREGAFDGDVFLKGLDVESSGAEVVHILFAQPDRKHVCAFAGLSGLAFGVVACKRRELHPVGVRRSVELHFWLPW